MFKTTMKLISCVVMSLFLVSCTYLKSEHYVGVQESMEDSGLKEESIWQFEDEVFYVRIVDPLTVIASSLEWDSAAKEYKVKTSQVVISKLDESMFLNVREEKEELYTILRLAPAMDGTIAIFTVDPEKIEKHIEEGKVKVTEEDSIFILKLTKEELDNYIRENQNDLFNYNSAGIIKPLGEYNEEE